MSFSAIIVAAGSGCRLGDRLPKAFIDLGGKPLFIHSLEIFCSHPMVTEVILVVSAAMQEKAEALIEASPIKTSVKCVAGGAERWLSVQNGAIAASSEWILVHDAARPFVSKAVIDAVIEKSDTFECVITATPMTDTVRERDGNKAGAVVDRSRLIRVGTPQLFKRELLLEAFKKAPAFDPPPTDEAALVQALGKPVGIAEGDPLNFKITTPADRTIAEALIEQRL